MVRIDNSHDEQNVDSCLECSAKTRQNIRDIFYIAQRTISFPSLPLYDKTTQTLTSSYSRILRHVFRFFDHDCDGLWSTSELNAFQVSLLFMIKWQKHSFSTQLSSQEIDSLLNILKESNPTSFVHPLPYSDNQEGISEEGFLELMRLFLHRDRPESNWVMLRSLGQQLCEFINRYNDDLTWKVQPGDLNVTSRGKIPEWSEEGLKYLNQVEDYDD